MALLAYLKKPSPSKAVLPSPTCPFSLQMLSSWIVTIGELMSTRQSLSNGGHPYSLVNMIALMQDSVWKHNTGIATFQL